MITCDEVIEETKSLQQILMKKGKKVVLLMIFLIIIQKSKLIHPILHP